MKYTHDYAKLKLSKYTTIRRYKKVNLHDIVLESFPSGCHKAQVVKIERKTLDEVDILLLLRDTDERSRTKACLLIQSFYKKPIDFKKELFYIYHLKVIQNLGGKS